MSFLMDLLASFSGWFQPHLTFISSALIATILVIYGGRLNRAVWSLVRGAHFIFRTLVFVALCAFGYGALSVYLVPIVRKLLLLGGSLWLGPIVLVLFVAVGLLAEKHSRKS